MLLFLYFKELFQQFLLMKSYQTFKTKQRHVEPYQMASQPKIAMPTTQKLLS